MGIMREVAVAGVYTEAERYRLEATPPPPDLLPPASSSPPA
jgi:hypothetical protein